MYWLALFFLFTTATATAGTQHVPSNNTRLQCHDENFKPDFFLQVTYENTSVACQHRMSVLVNGTLPGPTLRLPPGRASWVRVCNDMNEYNTTMVLYFSTFENLLVTILSTGMVLVNAQRLSATAPLSLNGPLLHINALITRSTQRKMIPGHTFIIPMSGFKLSVRPVC